MQIVTTTSRWSYRTTIYGVRGIPESIELAKTRVLHATGSSGLPQLATECIKMQHRPDVPSRRYPGERDGYLGAEIGFQPLPASSYVRRTIGPPGDLPPRRTGDVRSV